MQYDRDNEKRKYKQQTKFSSQSIDWISLSRLMLWSTLSSII